MHMLHDHINDAMLEQSGRVEIQMDHTYIHIVHGFWNDCDWTIEDGDSFDIKLGYQAHFNILLSAFKNVSS